LKIIMGEAVKQSTYTSFLVPVVKTLNSRYYKPRISSKHKERENKLEAQADAIALILPATAGGAMEYQSNVDFEEILMCDDTAVAEGFDVRILFSHGMIALCQCNIEHLARRV
jgi:hypothetical protein